MQYNNYQCSRHRESQNKTNTIISLTNYNFSIIHIAKSQRFRLMETLLIPQLDHVSHKLNNDKTNTQANRNNDLKKKTVFSNVIEMRNAIAVRNPVVLLILLWIDISFTTKAAKDSFKKVTISKYIWQYIKSQTCNDYQQY